MGTLIVISILILFLTGLLVLPARIIVDTGRNNYYIEIPIYFRAQLVPDNQLFYLKLRLFFIPIKINPRWNKGKDLKKQTDIKKTERDRKPTPDQIIKLLAGIFKTWSIKKFVVDIDTGDFPLNAQLIPLAQLANDKNIQIRINFENRNYAHIEIFTRIYKILAVLIKNKLINNKN